jgi:hypothetical protein
VFIVVKPSSTIATVQRRLSSGLHRDVGAKDAEAHYGAHMDQHRLEDAVDHSEIRRLQDAYADIVSRRQWRELTDVFLADTVLELDLRERTLTYRGPQDIGDFIGESIAQFAFFQFGILGTRVQLRTANNPDSASARMYMTELRQAHTGHWSQIYGVYHDRLVRANGQWRFAHRRYHSLARNNMPATVFDFPHHLTLDDL